MSSISISCIPFPTCARIKVKIEKLMKTNIPDSLQWGSVIRHLISAIYLTTFAFSNEKGNNETGETNQICPG